MSLDQSTRAKVDGRVGHDRFTYRFVPALWAEFIFNFVVMATRAVSPGYFLVDRVSGTIQVQDIWVFVSPS